VIALLQVWKRLWQPTTTSLPVAQLLRTVKDTLSFRICYRGRNSGLSSSQAHKPSEKGLRSETRRQQLTCSLCFIKRKGPGCEHFK